MSPKCIPLNLLYVFDLSFSCFWNARFLRFNLEFIAFLALWSIYLSPISSDKTSIFASLECSNVWKWTPHGISSSKNKLFEVHKPSAWQLRIEFPFRVFNKYPNTIGWIELTHLARCILKIPSGALSQVFSTRVPNIPLLNWSRSFLSLDCSAKAADIISKARNKSYKFSIQIYMMQLNKKC